MVKNLRKFHRQVAPFLFLPLLLTAVTGVGYRIGRSWFNLPSDAAEFFLVLHEGRFLGQPLVPIYVLWIGLSLLAMLVTGWVMVSQRKPLIALPKKDWRSVHRFVAPIALLPLGVSAITGIAYRLGKAWFNLPPEQTSFLLRLHQGTYLGSSLRPFYVLLVGSGLVGLLITGIQLTPLFRKRKVPAPPGS
ncbi:PepSY domain-containing protein [Prochlorothrix hollandica]|uniref:Peptidase n=1 Tax=Prochlorothrix hollandica PCC 9006 = CALU 1027 TaxID=317619 RepID=A0A0M2Q3M3_PROHO|nr:PepSY domain-containing protein [Prochlorothrix hollandica]KKJ01544.1 peptidase [Prochlorothrix hollandica PCC 9006 = CALU 1027]